MRRLLNLLGWTLWLIVSFCHLVCAAGPAPVKPQQGQPAMTAAQIEADWITENAVRGIPAILDGSITPEEDAAGGCDGVKNGRWGFHTALEEDAWWQIVQGFFMNTVTIIDVIYAFCAVAVATFHSKRRLNRYQVLALRKHAEGKK